MRGKRLFLNCGVEAAVDHDGTYYTLRFSDIPKRSDSLMPIREHAHVSILMSERGVRDLIEHLQDSIDEVAGDVRKEAKKKIVVNGREYVVEGDMDYISHAFLVSLVGVEIGSKVTFDNGPYNRVGRMYPGDAIELYEGVEFRVEALPEPKSDVEAIKPSVEILINGKAFQVGPDPMTYLDVVIKAGKSGDAVVSYHRVGQKAATRLIQGSFVAPSEGMVFSVVEPQTTVVDLSEESRANYVVVNGRVHFFRGESAQYEQVVALAGKTGDYPFTVTWRAKDPKASGELSPGESVRVSRGMIFNVAHTGSA